MGESGTLVLINGTTYDWVCTKTSSSQMNAWVFPDRVPAGTTASVHVEFDEGIFCDEEADGGEVYYVLEGTGTLCSFQLRARVKPGNKYTLQAFFDEIASANNPQGSTVELGWTRGGLTPFVLSGTLDRFSSSNPPSDWMQKNLGTLGQRTLRQLCMPGSHDSGMSIVTGHTGLADADIVLTQSHDIGTQLAFGARYFDVRPVIAAGTFKTGHYSHIEVLGWQGADGQMLQDVVRQVNEFTAANKELIVLNLSHDLNRDVGREYRALNQEEWDQLFELLTGIEDLFVVGTEDPSAVDLGRLTLDQFIGNERAAVVVIVESTDVFIDLGDYATRGFYRHSQFDVYNVYSNKDDLDRMVTDQLDKMRARRVSPYSRLFLLSWTLTQDADDMLRGGSILHLAKAAKSALFTNLLPACSARTFPNILYLDNWTNSDPTALAMAINDMTNV